MSKMYYWETNSARKNFVFIKSLSTAPTFKTFEGHVPELVNWDFIPFYLDEEELSKNGVRNRRFRISINHLQ